MRKIKEILRLRYLAGLSYRKVASATGVPIASISNYCRRYEILPHRIEEALALDEEELEGLLFPEKQVQRKQRERPLPDPEYIHRQIRKKGVTFLLLWQEYKEQHPDGYSYTQFKEHYYRFKIKLNPSMRQVHLAGEKMFVDYSGLAFPVADAVTGEVLRAQIFVAVLGASGYTFVHATRSQKRQDFTSSRAKAF